MRFLQLNADLGEGEEPARTAAIMPWLQAANVACGGHAGGPETMMRSIRLAQRHGVKLGAHPGLPGHGSGMGRSGRAPSPQELSLLLLHQVSGLLHVSRMEGARLHHIKLHGLLYHLTELEERLARAYVTSVARWWPRLKVFALAGGRVVRMARAEGLTVWEEAFLDRGYRADGQLVPRTEKGAMITTSAGIVRRLKALRERGEIETVDGSWRSINPRTLCVHADTRGSVRLARCAAEWLAT